MISGVFIWFFDFGFLWRFVVITIFVLIIVYLIGDEKFFEHKENSSGKGEKND